VAVRHEHSERIVVKSATKPIFTMLYSISKKPKKVQIWTKSTLYYFVRTYFMALKYKKNRSVNFGFLTISV
jgi:exopolysaccharide biosynthesis protein